MDQVKTLRLIARVLGITLASCVDLLVGLAVMIINSGRIAGNSPPVIEFSLPAGLALYLSSVICAICVYRWRTKNGARGGLKVEKATLITVCILVLARAAVFAAVNNAPLDFSRVRQTQDNLQLIHSTLSRWCDENGTIPLSLEALSLDRRQIKDLWGFEIQYEVDVDDTTYSIRAIGVPDDVRDRFPDFELEMVGICRNGADAGSWVPGP